MNTFIFSILQVIRSISRKCKYEFLQSCPKEFFRFLRECELNLLKRNLEKEKSQMKKIQKVVKLLSLGRATWKQRREVLASEKSLQLIKVEIFCIINFCFDTGQFVVVLASQYNKCLTEKSFTKQELPKYQVEQNSTYQKHWLGNGKTKFFPQSRLFSR